MKMSIFCKVLCLESILLSVTSLSSASSKVNLNTKVVLLDERLSDVMFETDHLWTKSASSVTECANICNDDDACVSFTVSPARYASKSPGVSCDAYSAMMTSGSPRKTAPGSRLYDVMTTCPSAPATCKEAQDRGYTGMVQRLNIGGYQCVTAFCDGEWTVFQRRQDGSEDFYRDWKSYKYGFGNETREFWLGLEALHALTSSGPNEVRLDMADWLSGTAIALFHNFTVGPENTFYRLSYDLYQNLKHAGADALASNKGCGFSTWDADHDLLTHAHCAAEYKHGGWWYSGCGNCNPNGDYKTGDDVVGLDDGLIWRFWKGGAYSLRYTQMKIRPV